jgi:cholesterol oxidase
MGRDVPNGRLTLNGDRLESDWRIDRSDPYFARVRDAHRKMAKALGGTFSDNPLWLLGQRVITAHPLGGCPMGRDEREGVVSDAGACSATTGSMSLTGRSCRGRSDRTRA